METQILISREKIKSFFSYYIVVFLMTTISVVCFKFGLEGVNNGNVLQLFFLFLGIIAAGGVGFYAFAEFLQQENGSEVWATIRFILDIVVLFVLWFFLYQRISL